MAFTRVNPFGWFKSDTLSSAQSNQLDTNISNAIDKRTGQTDTISSTITVDGYFTFETGSVLNIQDPTAVTINDGELKIGATLVGSDGYPLRFGLADVVINATNFIVSSADYIREILVLTGVLTGNTTVWLPQHAGYSKIIDNQCTGNYTLTVKAGTGSGIAPYQAGVWIPNGKSGLVYCSGPEMISGPIKITNEVIDIRFMGETGSNYGVDFFHIDNGSSALDVTGYTFDFANVLYGDQFEITYTSGLRDAAATAYMQVHNSQSGYMKETMFEVTGVQRTTTISTIYTATADVALLTIKLIGYTTAGGGNDGYVCTPLSFTVKQIRP